MPLDAPVFGLSKRIRGADQIRTGVPSRTFSGHKSLEIEWIYFIQAGTTGPIKIGRTTKEPSARLQGLQTANPWPLHIVLTFRAPAELERELHRDLAEHRIHGEWFRPRREVWDAIEDCHEHYVIAPLLTYDEAA